MRGECEEGGAVGRGERGRPGPTSDRMRRGAALQDTAWHSGHSALSKKKRMGKHAVFPLFPALH